MKELVKKLLTHAEYRKVLHGVFSGCKTLDELHQKTNIDKENIKSILKELEEKGIIEISEDSIKTKLQDFMLIIDFKSGSVYAIFSENKAKEIRDFIAQHL